MDPELDLLIRSEVAEKTVRASLKLASLAEQLARSLQQFADSFERLADAPARAEARRSEFRRAECPGRFD
jgi:septal ring factor EnvC (AmiA/AmiB activator)